MREFVLVVIAVLLVYLLWLALRWLHLSRKNRKAAVAAPLQFREPGLAAYAAADEGVDDEDEHAPDAVVHIHPKPVAPPEPDASSFGFDALLEVRQTRHLTDALTRDVEALKQELSQLRQELADLRAASRVAPQYGEAVSHARRGLDAAAIAERCGISVAEAELVRSLIAMSPSGE